MNSCVEERASHAGWPLGFVFFCVFFFLKHRNTQNFNSRLTRDLVQLYESMSFKTLDDIIFYCTFIAIAFAQTWASVGSVAQTAHGINITMPYCSCFIGLFGRHRCFTPVRNQIGVWLKTAVPLFLVRIDAQYDSANKIKLLTSYTSRSRPL